MHKDTQEALRRLDEQLRSQELETAEPVPEEPDEADEDWFDDDTCDNLVYENYSNHYGRDLRNYANNYGIRNTDVTDVDLEEFSEAIQGESQENLAGLAFTAMILAGGIIILLVMWAVKYF